MTRDVDLSGLDVADALDLALLERAQELRLERHRHRRHLVDEERALVGGFEAADARVDGAGERALHVAEELGFGESFRNRGRVERDERLIARGLL